MSIRDREYIDPVLRGWLIPLFWRDAQQFFQSKSSIFKDRIKKSYIEIIPYSPYYHGGDVEEHCCGLVCVELVDCYSDDQTWYYCCHVAPETHPSKAFVVSLGILREISNDLFHNTMGMFDLKFFIWGKSSKNSLIIPSDILKWWNKSLVRRMENRAFSEKFHFVIQ